MNDFRLSPESIALITEILKQELDRVSGKKVLEFSRSGNTAITELADSAECYICIDNPGDSSGSAESEAESNSVNVIPYEELAEDCYFGRFHLVYTIFGFHGIPHLADEIMRLRRLIIKGGKMVIIDFNENGSEDNILKQMKRCGFSPDTAPLDLDGNPAFLITTQK